MSSPVSLRESSHPGARVRHRPADPCRARASALVPRSSRPSLLRRSSLASCRRARPLASQACSSDRDRCTMRSSLSSQLSCRRVNESTPLLTATHTYLYVLFSLFGPHYRIQFPSPRVAHRERRDRWFTCSLLASPTASPSSPPRGSSRHATRLILKFARCRIGLRADRLSRPWPSRHKLRGSPLRRSDVA